jgi:hypothetical protein
MIGIPRRITQPQTPLCAVFVALFAGWGSGYYQAIWQARADAATTALAAIQDIEDSAYSKGAAAAFIGAADACRVDVDAALDEYANRARGMLEYASPRLGSFP